MQQQLFHLAFHRRSVLVVSPAAPPQEQSSSLASIVIEGCKEHRLACLALVVHGETGRREPAAGK